MEGFQVPTSAILILSQGSGWHGNLILGSGRKEGGVIFRRNLFKHAPPPQFSSLKYPPSVEAVHQIWNCDFARDRIRCCATRRRARTSSSRRRRRLFLRSSVGPVVELFQWCMAWVRGLKSGRIPTVRWDGHQMPSSSSRTTSWSRAASSEPDPDPDPPPQSAHAWLRLESI